MSTPTLQITTIHFRRTGKNARTLFKNFHSKSRRKAFQKRDGYNIKKDLDRPTAQAIKKLGLREISLGKKNTRIYPQGSMAAHILKVLQF